MQPQDVAPRHAPRSASVDAEQAEAALVEHYPRLVRLAYLVLPPSLGRHRRALTAHSLAQRSLPRGRGAGDDCVPPPRRADGRDPGYVYLRGRVLTAALEAAAPRRWTAWPKRAQLPPVLPLVWGLRLFPRCGGADELALEQRLSGLSGPARAAYVLRGLERLDDGEVLRALRAAGVADPKAALARAAGAGAQFELLASAEFDPCALQARPTDLVRRRRRTRAALAATAAVVVCGALLALPDGGLGGDGAAGPSYARKAVSEQALQPARLGRVAAFAWKTSARIDFSAWPTRGDRAGDTALLRRALAVWARPGDTVQVSATPGTPAGPPMGAPQLLYAGTVDDAVVVLFYDGLRVVRYAESKDGGAAAALDFARVDGADEAASDALVVGRTDGNVRYLTAPWVRNVDVRDLLTPKGVTLPLRRTADGVTDPVRSPDTSRSCASWNALTMQDGAGKHLVTDLGELTPARLVSGPPGRPHDVTGAADRASWAHTACLLPAVRSHGVRAVNSWQFATQQLPEANGGAAWLCTRAETWRGTGSRVLAEFLTPGGKPSAPGAVVARAEDSPACGTRQPRALAGVLWKSRGGHWYVLAAGSRQITSLATTGEATGSTVGRLLAVPAKQGAQAQLSGRLVDGTRVTSLR
ncbi:hypothetical protein OG709_09070 [Streptomyces sp. NBC_01267]|uniref:hypothetical protein n=1 Tax=Streptomyces sp. NBC_01267 TaxID=2903805 RepID=UPI002E326B6D|nr:hypothetical protein [Streptomyces sp. NBC_01267]